MGVRVLMVLTVVSLVMPAAPVRAGTATEPPMEFNARTFALQSLPLATLPYHSWTDPKLPLQWTPTDSDGIKMRWIGGQLYYHPVELGFLGLRLLAAYERTAKPDYLLWARRYAAKIRQISVDSDGALFVPYRFYYASEGLRPPWYSGMSQGVALSLFVRLYRVTGVDSYLDTARLYFRSFRRSGPSDRPWVSRISDWGYLWIEEYPRNDREDRVLNGFMYAIYGLYDWWEATRQAAGRQLLQGALTTLRRNVLLYRVPGGISYYCLGHHSRHASYHLIHIDQLRHIARMSGDPYFSDVADLFESDYDGT